MNLILKNIKEFYLYIVLYIIGLLFLSFSVGSVIHLAKDFQTEIYKDLNQFNSGTIPLNMVYLSNYKKHKTYNNHSNSMLVELDNGIKIIIPEKYEKILKGEVYYKYYFLSNSFTLRICLSHENKISCYLPINENYLKKILFNPLLNK